MENTQQHQQKRKREPIFEFTEKALLVELVSKHFDVLECKKTDMTNVKKRNSEWEKIGDAFNASSSMYNRDWRTLKTLWENMKRRAKIVISTQNDNTKGTGGGKAKKLMTDPVIENVVSLIRPHIEAFTNPYDNNEDGAYDELDTQSKISKSYSAGFLNNCVFDMCDDQLGEDQVNLDDSSTVPAEKTVPDKDWSYYNPGMLKTPLSDALQTQKDVLSSSKHSKVQPNENKSRRRPVLKKTDSEDLALAKLSTLSSAQAEASEEHHIQMKILGLQLKQEEEKYKQEQIRTELLKQQLLRETGITWDV